MGNPINLEQIKQNYLEKMETYKARVIVCCGTGCMASGAMKTYERFIEVIKQKGLTVSVSLKKEASDYIVAESGCQGFCQMGPLVQVFRKGCKEGILYAKVQPEDVDEVVEKTLVNDGYAERLLFRTRDGKDYIKDMNKVPFYEKQNRIVFGLCGHIDALDLDEYIANDGYFMARKAVLEMTDEQICKEVLDSGLRGRGGAGFPTGRKWDYARMNESDVKYVICNGDEGDPGAFMDRCVLEGNPHNVFEGMIITAMAINSTIGYIYVRMEYPLAVRRLKHALKDARDAGILGKNIFGSNKDFDITIMEGAGAFVCGEETALIASVEGKRGMPTLKPPFPAESGLFGKPSIINNVETLATVPFVLRMGAEEYAKMGTEKSKGTKTFALTGHVANTGLIEVEFGTTLREIVDDIGGGVLDDKENNCGVDFKAVQIGGPSGGCLTQEHLDLPLDFENLTEVGAMLGSGGLVVMNQDSCMVKIARFFMQFTQNESCGKCTVCREGTRQMLWLLDDIMDGKGTKESLELLEELAETVKIGSLCMLGKTAPNPVLSTLRFFRDEYDAHVYGKYCPTGSCEGLATFTIDMSLCKECSLCIKACPVDAITGKRKEEPFVIDQEKCIKCGVCVDACKFKAIIKK